MFTVFSEVTPHSPVIIIFERNLYLSTLTMKVTGLSESLVTTAQGVIFQKREIFTIVFIYGSRKT
jgi:hypothetical protein